MKESFEIKEVFNASPSDIYNAFLDSTKHSEMTGGEAECGKNIGDKFTAWDGYIEGSNIELIPNKTIIQNWRTSEFDANDEDSKLVIHLTKVDEGTEVTIEHSNIPEGETQYLQGWKDHYFSPMKAFFNEV
jgi:activator of HSP90 ATPase